MLDNTASNAMPCSFILYFNYMVKLIFFKLCLEPTESSMEDSSTTDRLNFDRFDICRLLQHGASLLGSAGAEFEVQDEKSG